MKSDAATGPRPEPSLAMRMASADMEDAFETGAPPFDADMRTESDAESIDDRRPADVEPPAADMGGRVNAARATYGHKDRIGVAADGGPVLSVGAAMTTPSPPQPGDTSADDEPEPSHV